MTSTGGDPDALTAYALQGVESARALRTRAAGVGTVLDSLRGAPSDVPLSLPPMGAHLTHLAGAWHELDADVGRVADALRRADTPFGALAHRLLLSRLLAEPRHGTQPWQADPATVAAALDDVRAALDPGGWGVRGNDLDALRDTFAALDGVTADAVLAAMSEAELARWHDQMREGRLKGGWSREQREELYVVVGSRVSLAQWRRFGAHTEEVDPDPVGALSDSARDDADRVAWANDLGYAPLDAALVATDGDDVGPFDLDDVLQGSIGDCYFVSGMQALATQAPDALAEMFEPHPNGTFTVTFGDGRSTLVSPDLVVDTDGRLAFARLRDGHETELWPLLLEKAYAQRNGGWEPIVGGHPSEAVEALTGFEGSREAADDVSLDELADAHDRGAILHIGTIHVPDGMTKDEWRDSEAPEPFVRGGGTYERLHPQHAFIVVDVDRTADAVTVRNPWNPTEGTVVLTMDELQRSSNQVYVNEVP